jgi:membrane-bound metal-dependent hydrolase YbcI (DUF457 family)
MPSPLGHALAGAAAGWLVAGRVSTPDRLHATLWRRGVAFALIAMAPDLDLIVGAHSGPTHSVGAALLVGLATLAFTREPRMAVAALTAYATHPLLDWLGTDGSPPIGVMAFWPFSDAYFAPKVHLFYAVSRRYWMPDFVVRTVRAVAWEVLILLPPVAIAYGFCRNTSRRMRS